MFIFLNYYCFSINISSCLLLLGRCDKLSGTSPTSLGRVACEMAKASGRGFPRLPVGDATLRSGGGKQIARHQQQMPSFPRAEDESTAYQRCDEYVFKSRDDGRVTFLIERVVGRVQVVVAWLRALADIPSRQGRTSAEH